MTTNDTPTPGERAYAAYARLMQPHHAMSLWGFLPPYCQAAWEAAAQAVLTAWIASPDWPTPQPQEDTP